MSMIEETVKTLDFDTISTMAMEDDEGVKSKEYADDCMLESKMKTSSRNRINKKISHLHFHIM